MSLYLGNNLISGSKPINLGVRNIGEIVSSSLPLTDAGLHLLDGSLIQGDGVYSDFVDYIADLYNSGSEYTYIQPTNPTGITSTSGWSNVSNAFDNNSSTYATISNTTGYIEWDFGQTLGLTGISINGSWVSAVAHNVNFIVYSVNSNNEETIIAHTSGSSQSASYITSATFTKVNCNKIRIYADDYYPGAPARVIQINITATSTRAQYFCSQADWETSINTYGVCGKFVYNATANTVRLPKITGIVEGTTDATALGDLVEAGLPNITGKFDMGDRRTHIEGTSGAIYTNTVSSNKWGAQSDASGNTQGVGFNASRSNSIYGKSSTVQPQTIKALLYIVVATSTKTDIQVDIDEIATDLNGKADVDLTNTTDQAKILMAGMGMPSDKYIDLTLGASGSTYTAPANGYYLCWIGGASGKKYLKLYTSGGYLQEAGFTTDNNIGFTVPIQKGQTLNVKYSGTLTVRGLKFIYAEGEV